MRGAEGVTMTVWHCRCVAINGAATAKADFVHVHDAGFIGESVESEASVIEWAPTPILMMVCTCKLLFHCLHCAAPDLSGRRALTVNRSI